MLLRQTWTDVSQCPDLMNHLLPSSFHNYPTLRSIPIQINAKHNYILLINRDILLEGKIQNFRAYFALNSKQCAHKKLNILTHYYILFVLDFSQRKKYFPLSI